MFKSAHRTLAALAVVALSACSSPPNGGTGPTIPVLPPGGGVTQQSFAGIGDSLTFGEQSEGMLGDPSATSPASGLPGGIVPVTQENGFWALMYAQMNGIALDPAHYNVTTKLGDAATSPLPLIHAPGLGAQLVVSSVSPPFSAIQSPCDAFNQSAYDATNWGSTRMNPGAPIADLAIRALHDTSAPDQVAAGQRPIVSLAVVTPGIVERASGALRHLGLLELDQDFLDV